MYHPLERTTHPDDGDDEHDDDEGDGNFGDDDRDHHYDVDHTISGGDNTHCNPIVDPVKDRGDSCVDCVLHLDYDDYDFDYDDCVLHLDYDHHDYDYDYFMFYLEHDDMMMSV